jgi:peptidoglycan/LPS O-acetylase OafA/YrhL
VQNEPPARAPLPPGPACETDPADSAPPRVEAPLRYTLIDGLRGFAALAVLCWHYQHFFMSPQRDLPVVAALDLPLRWLLEPFYTQGFHGVEVFWTISGFVFATVYSASRATTRDFAVNRLARLYPLHFVTLLVVAGLQLLALGGLGRWLIYGNNDLIHFVGQILFIGGEGRNASFNAPIWSVSVELAIYAVFWAARGWLEQRPALRSLVFAGAFTVAHKFVGDAITACGAYFFFLRAAPVRRFIAPRHRRSAGWVAPSFWPAVPSATLSGATAARSRTASPVSPAR